MSETSRQRRLVEFDFPLRQASIDSVHEKNVRHGHVSTLHVWPARRPLAACRAALIATLLPDPGDAQGRRKLVERIGGTTVPTTKTKRLPGGRVEEIRSEETVGGVLHWGRENDPALDALRDEIRKAFGGRAPRILDPFAGGGAIPLEAMRLGCEAVAADINPVAWMLLRCTLLYPQRLGDRTRPLPAFAAESALFMEQYFRSTERLTRKQLERNLEAVQLSMLPPPEHGLAWHVRAWGWWVLERARTDLATRYPVVDGKPTVAYLWARTVICKRCRATIPLLKTKWLCRTDRKRELLTLTPNADRSGVAFGVEHNVPKRGGNAAQRREADRAAGEGTWRGNGATCPVCSPDAVVMDKEDLKLEGRADRMGSVMTAVVVDGTRGKEYRAATDPEREAAEVTDDQLEAAFANIPFGCPDEPLPKGALGFRAPLYGFDRWSKLFTRRQLIAMATFVRHVRAVRERMRELGYDDDWIEAVSAYLALAVDRLADRSCSISSWDVGREIVRSTFSGFRLPMVWDFAEVMPTSDSTGGFDGAVAWIGRFVDHAASFASDSSEPTTLAASAIRVDSREVDIVVTDPPYYDAIPYSDLMDFFYVWLRRSTTGLTSEIDEAFMSALGPKWDHEEQDGELIDESNRFGGDKYASRDAYERGMQRAFEACHRALTPEGLLVIVFAHKDPIAWEALVGAIIRAGFVVDASWPIQTEMSNRTRALASAALSSSVWLVCRKRSATARPGWDNRVLAEMRERIPERLRDFWDAGIRGPDFVWAATGPALESYSRHPLVKKANEPGQAMSVSEFLSEARQIVVEFVVGRVLEGGDDGAPSIDPVTSYYVLHRSEFGLSEVPIGACILYAVSCGLSDTALVDRYDLLTTSASSRSTSEDEEDETAPSGGKTARLKEWKARSKEAMGYATEKSRPPLIDEVHRLMHLWRAGDVVMVDRYLDDHGLRRNAVFPRLLQALIEQATGEERSILESLSNHVAERGQRYADPLPEMTS